MISVELDTYKDAAYELNKIFVETVGTIRKRKGGKRKIG